MTRRAQLDPDTLAILGLVLGWLATGCPTPRVCSPAETRCMADAERVEVCDSSGQWTTALDCLAVEQASGGQWRCQDATDEGEAHACLPVDQPVIQQVDQPVIQQVDQPVIQQVDQPVIQQADRVPCLPQEAP